MAVGFDGRLALWASKACRWRLVSWFSRIDLGVNRRTWGIAAAVRSTTVNDSVDVKIVASAVSLNVSETVGSAKSAGRAATTWAWVWREPTRR